jgi:hypothetical protein
MSILRESWTSDVERGSKTEEGFPDQVVEIAIPHSNGYDSPGRRLRSTW